MSRFPMPEGEVEFLLKDLTQPSPANAPTRWRGSVRTGDDRTLSIWAIVRVSAPCSRVVATEALSVGRPILETQVREEKYQGFPFGNNCSITLADVVGRAPIRTLRSGSAIAPESTVEPIVISSGDGIVAEFRSSRVRVTAEVVALGSGRIGDSISVRNPSSKKIFSATVSGAGHVVVEDIQ
jgi:flagella basal body P-ring formation protein FlgA